MLPTTYLLVTIHDLQARSKFESERKRLVEAHKINESIGMLLREMEPRLGSIETDRKAPQMFTAMHKI